MPRQAVGPDPAREFSVDPDTVLRLSVDLFDRRDRSPEARSGPYLVANVPLGILNVVHRAFVDRSGPVTSPRADAPAHEIHVPKSLSDLRSRGLYDALLASDDPARSRSYVAHDLLSVVSSSGGCGLAITQDDAAPIDNGVSQNPPSAYSSNSRPTSSITTRRMYSEIVSPLTRQASSSSARFFFAQRTVVMTSSLDLAFFTPVFPSIAEVAIQICYVPSYSVQVNGRAVHYVII